MMQLIDSMTIIRTVFNVIYVLAFASSVAVAVKEVQSHKSVSVPTSPAQAQAMRTPSASEGMFIQHSLSAKN